MFEDFFNRGFLGYDGEVFIAFVLHMYLHENSTSFRQELYYYVSVLLHKWNRAVRICYL